MANPEKEIIKSIQNNQTKLTVADASSITGLGIEESKSVLETLFEKYRCNLKVTENGDLIYDFGNKLFLRTEKTFKEKWAEIKAYIGGLLMIIFKILITVVLLVYFVIFTVILILIIIAASSKNDSDTGSSSKKSGGGSFGNFMITQIFFSELRSIFYWHTITGNTVYSKDRYGYRHKVYQPRSGAINKNKKSKVAAVYDFVFGPPRVEIHPLENEKEAVSYINQNKGIITTNELMGLASWRKPEAENFFSKLLLNFDGEGKISDNGTLFGDFYTLIRKAGSQKNFPITWYWDEYEPEYEITGNSVGTNAAIIFFALFNLIGGILFLSTVLSPEAASGILYTVNNSDNLLVQSILGTLFSNPAQFSFVLGWFPTFFFSAFLAYPLYRSFIIKKKNHNIHLENIRKRLLKEIYLSNQDKLNIDELTSLTNSRNNNEEKLEKEAIKMMMDDLIYDLEGEMIVDDQAQILYDFSRFKTDLKEIESLRAQRKLDNSLGDIMIESNNE
ncbi:hypothetical protein [Flexithrix dorotheae]|uniref:hypothetical protein n=1 Tax=Flexithrix dorotheae TaxID=70993 RepID=UPI0003699361|nr:hypothetical protein [Flexithrix dorotheae]